MKIRRLTGAAALMVLLFAGLPLAAQAAHFSDATSTLHGGLGSNPVGVAVDRSGNIFASDNGHNAVYEIVAAGGYTTVKTLGSGFKSPWGVAVDGSGNVFVAEYGNGAVKEILAAGGYTTVNTLGSGFRYPEGVAVDGSGNVFVADTGHSQVKEILAAGGYTTVNILGSGFNEPTSVALDSSGNVFLLDDLDDYLYTTVKEILAAGGYTTVRTVIPVPNSTAPGFCCAAGVAVDGSGNVYLTTDHFGPQYTISEVLAVNGSIPASPVIISRGTGLFMPTGVAVDGSGNIFVGNQEFGGIADVLEITSPRGNFSPVNVGSTGLYRTEFVFTFDAGGTLSNTPYRVLTQGAPNLDFSPGTGGATCAPAAVFKTGDTCTVSVTFKPRAPGPRYGAVELFGSTGNLLATAYIQGTGVAPQVVFNPSAISSLGGGFSPAGVAVDAHGNIYVADYYNSAVDEMPPGCTSQACVTALGGGFNYPGGVAVDGAGNVYVADTFNSALKQMPPNCFSAACVIPLGGGLEPTSVAVDGSGNVYVADYANNEVKELPPGCTATAYTANQCTIAVLGGGFSQPEGVAVDGIGNVYVGDLGNNAVKQMPPGCLSLTCVKSLGGGFDNPDGVAVDGSGNIYVTDFYNNAVKQIPPGCASSACVTTLSADFSTPEGIALDGSGNIYATNGLASSIQEIHRATPPSLGFSQTPVGSQSSDGPQIVTVSNNGNAALIFPVPGSGTNPSMATGFTLDGATTCPQLSISSSAGTLYAGTSCDYAVDFIPLTAGTDSGSLVLTDNNLNAGSPGYATQSIGLAGIGGITPAITWAMPAAIIYGTALSAKQLDATSTVAGKFTYTPATGTVLGAGAQTLSVTLNPTDTTHYLAATKTVSLTVMDRSTLTSPAPSTVLAGPKVTFTWTTSPAATGYIFRLGTTVGGNNLLAKALTGTSITPTTLPANGETIYARLVTEYGSIQLYNDYVFTAATQAALTAPAPTTVLTGPKVTFTWSAGTSATGYILRLGTTVGGNNLFVTGTTGTSATPTNLPANGQTIHARLVTVYGSSQAYTDYVFTAATQAVMTSPTPNMILASSTVTFTWTAAPNATGYILRLGTTVGGNNIFAKALTVTSVTPSNLPTNGQTVYARLVTVYGANQVYTDYVYTAATAATMISPAPNSVLTGAVVTFTWTAAPNATSYILRLGTTVGGNNLFAKALTGTSATPIPLPTNGETIYARLVTVNGSSQAYIDYVYTAAP